MYVSKPVSIVLLVYVSTFLVFIEGVDPNKLKHAYEIPQYTPCVHTAWWPTAWGQSIWAPAVWRLTGWGAAVWGPPVWDATSIDIYWDPA